MNEQLWLRLRQAIVLSPAYPFLVWPRNKAKVILGFLGGRRRKRRVHGFCVGTAKSGTHSIAAVFDESLRVAHEPDSVTLMRLLRGEAFYATRSPRTVRTLRHRDLVLGLELESSHLLGPFVERLAQTFPSARFIQPIRERRPWLRSIIDQQLRKRGSPKDAKWWPIWDFYFQADRFAHPPEERVLEKYGLHTLDGYLSYWRVHNETVLRAVPTERLFVLRTSEIDQRLAELGMFLGLPPRAADPDRAHAYSSRRRFDVVGRLDPDYVAGKLHEHRSELVDRVLRERRSARLA